MSNTIPQDYIKAFEPCEKIGLLATISPEGLPHITLITSLQANTPTQMIWGQFLEGLSKENIKRNPKVGFLIMSLAREFWTGQAQWTHSKREGPEYIMFNNKPLFRYNTYTGIHTVHYMDLIDISEKTKLDTGAVAKGAILTKLAKSFAAAKQKAPILNSWTEQLFNNFVNLKFISYIDEKGFPVILPIIQAQAADSTRIAFTLSPYAHSLKGLKHGAKVAVYCMNLEMESVLIEGKFIGLQNKLGIEAGLVDIDRVYNSMPPKHGYIYPKETLQAVTEF